MNKYEFLPQTYKAPSSSNNYMRLQDGENKIRILSAPVLGWEDWENKKPIRYAFDDKPSKSVDPKLPVKHFWAMIVWNYVEEQIQVLQITQAGIRNGIEALSKDTDWGAPYFYDIKIIKSGEGKDTEYKVNPLPHKILNPMIQKSFMEKRCLLDALFQNEDPFSKEWGTYTDGIFEEGTLQIQSSTLSDEQAIEVQQLLDNCDDSYGKDLLASLNVRSVWEIPQSLYLRVKNSIMAKIEIAKTKSFRHPNQIEALI